VTPASTVEAALADRDPLPGTAGFAGEFDGRLARDVLGREPLFFDSDTGDWDRTPTEGRLRRFPAGHVRDAEGVRRVWSLPEPPPAEPERALGALREAVTATLADLGPVPVAFSGGVDSALVAAHTEGPLYVAGFPESDDVAAARTAADRLGRELRVVELSHADLEAAVPAVARATGRTNAMDVAIAVPLFLVGRRVAADGFDALALGQGADELFGGYAKVAGAPDDDRVDADTVRGARDELLAGLPEQCERDVLALRAAGVEPRTPLLHDRVVRAALPLPEALLVAEGTRKVALRRVAADHVPSAVATREKKALQYGSLVSRELDRLARQAGFKRRLDDHVTRYVESLLA
jgi:asparagine synthase (glutamine-hydrolysing)